MSGPKEPPELKHLLPPYPDYEKFFFTGNDPNVTLKVNDPRHGFRHASKEFSFINAWWLAELTGLVYDNKVAVERRCVEAGMPQVEECDTKDKADTQCFVAYNDDFAIVAFRGTESDQRVDDEFTFEHIFNDWQTDFKANQTALGEGRGQAHTGFKTALDAVWPDLRAHLTRLNDGRRTFWITGHSLGGALATLAFARTAELERFTAHGLYTFGSPLVGDAGFKSYFEDLLRKYDIEYYRFVNNQDIVPLVPPEKYVSLKPSLAFFHYGHVGTLKYIDRDGLISGGLPALARLFNFLGSLARSAAGFFNRDTPRKVRYVPGRLKDHVPMFYATHIWNAHVKEAGQ